VGEEDVVNHKVEKSLVKEKQEEKERREKPKREKPKRFGRVCNKYIIIYYNVDHGLWRTNAR